MTSREDTNSTGGLRWRLADFRDLTLDELYDLLRLRQQIFVVEQECVFLDADGYDRAAHHLLGRPATGELVAYLRILPPGSRFPEPSLGRVVIASTERRKGFGRKLMAEGILRAHSLYPGTDLKLSAQRYLERFYRSFGFIVDSAPYDEDGIPHVDMILRR